MRDEMSEQNAPDPLNLNCSDEPVDVKPTIKPFPLQPPERPLDKSTASKELLPLLVVKQEPSPLSISSPLRQKTSPIYISSDSESEDAGEVDAQMNVSQSVTMDPKISDVIRQPQDEPSDKDAGEENEQDDAAKQDGKGDQVQDEQKEQDENEERVERDSRGGHGGQNEQAVQNEQDDDEQDELDEADDEEPSNDLDGEQRKIKEEKDSNKPANHEDVDTAPPKSPLHASSVASPSPPSSSTSSDGSSSSSSSSSSSLSSTTPFKASSMSKPQPKPKPPSSSQPPLAAMKKLKRPLPLTQPSSTQPVAPPRRAFIRERTNDSVTVVTSTVVGDQDDDDKRYTKRQKTDSVGPSRSKIHHTPRTRHPDYWFLDGVVIIVVENVMFRLHRSRLSNSSQYFHDLFLGPKPSEIVDNLPVYPVMGVSVSDFEQLLIALDNAITYVYNPPTFPQLASILRAAQKFRFSTLEDFASRTLRQRWPRDLSKLTDTRIPHASETIILSRKCDMPELSKRAFYELVRTTRLGEDEDADTEDPDVAEKMISRQDLARLIKAREELVSRWILTAGNPPDITCGATNTPDHPPLDKPKLLSDWQEHVKSSLFEECIYDPLIGLQRLMDIKWEGLGYCGACVGAWRDVWQAQRVKLWQQLDLWLDLPADKQL